MARPCGFDRPGYIQSSVEIRRLDKLCTLRWQDRLLTSCHMLLSVHMGIGFLQQGSIERASQGLVITLEYLYPKEALRQDELQLMRVLSLCGAALGALAFGVCIDVFGVDVAALGSALAVLLASVCMAATQGLLVMPLVYQMSAGWFLLMLGGSGWFVVSLVSVQQGYEDYSGIGGVRVMGSAAQFQALALMLSKVSGLVSLSLFSVLASYDLKPQTVWIVISSWMVVKSIAVICTEVFARNRMPSPMERSVSPYKAVGELSPKCLGFLLACVLAVLEQMLMYSNDRLRSIVSDSGMDQQLETNAFGGILGYKMTYMSVGAWSRALACCLAALLFQRMQSFTVQFSGFVICAISAYLGAHWLTHSSFLNDSVIVANNVCMIGDMIVFVGIFVFAANLSSSFRGTCIGIVFSFGKLGTLLMWKVVDSKSKTRIKVLKSECFYAVYVAIAGMFITGAYMTYRRWRGDAA